MRSKMQVTNKIMAIIQASDCLGIIIWPFIIGQLIKEMPIILFYQSLSTVFLCFCMFVVAFQVSKKVVILSASGLKE